MMMMMMIQVMTKNHQLTWRMLLTDFCDVLLLRVFRVSSKLSKKIHINYYFYHML